MTNTATIENKPAIGTEISSNDDKYPIASWNAKRGGFLAKIFFYNGSDVPQGLWLAVSNQQYGSSGMIVFIKERPKMGQKLKINKISEKVAFADIV
ncbi:MAG: hypothetical protein AAB681_02120 [Patescibacteria group bacterium]